MGRPLNKKFFGDPAGGGFQIACLADVGAGNVTAHIVSQRSNTAYLCAETATPSNNAICTLVDGAPSAPGEAQVTVTPENALTPVEATFTFDSNGSVDAVQIVSGGYGYWVGGTFNITTASGEAGDDAAVVTYTVANGVIVTATPTTPGTTYNNQSGASVNTADIPDEDANPPVQNARIINARTVKTFDTNTFAWPTTAPLGQNDRGLGEADLQGS